MNYLKISSNPLKKTLMNKVSMLLGLEFKSNNILKSKAMEPKKNYPPISNTV